ncbi:Alpha/Beta hydrolase protein [Mycena metata]|uniref:Carboxylic ester hydrolase n=1 Tax=Mycena metata TaxID=1033252 RepID=A0AAD7P2S7_9AGAR|nr:Alpha/Beta hydrolase protein [Mycena metata]
MVWIYGGSLAFGTASLSLYDGTSFAKNQNVVVVTLNYRTNVFGFPGSPDLPLTGSNLGYLDQELALRWVRNNVAKFGGDPEQVTIMGQSAGSKSVAAAILRYSAANAPFRAAVLLSGAEESTSPVPSFASFDGFSTAVNCTQTPGPARLACLKNVPASVIRSFTNGPSSGAFGPIVDNVTRFSDPIQRLRDGLTANVPFIMGNMQDDGTLFAFGLTDLPAFLETNFGSSITVNQVRPLYPGLNDSAIISEIEKDFLFLCPAQLWTSAAVSAGIKDIYRYTYGAVFADLQLFPGAGAWHSSEIQEIFGTFNSTTATPAEATLSHTMQTLIANFIKNPAAPPAPNWPRYVPGRKAKTLAKLAYEGNVALGDVVQVTESDEVDGPCQLWDTILDVRE